MDLEELNRFYAAPSQRRDGLLHTLLALGLPVEAGWYSGHYYKVPGGGYQMASYPIPVLTIKGLCDVEVNLDSVSVSTKLRRERALGYSFERIPLPFEAYGIEDYLADYYEPGMSFQVLRQNLEKSGEEEIGFSFQLDQEGGGLLELAGFLQGEGFYY